MARDSQRRRLYSAEGVLKMFSPSQQVKSKYGKDIDFTERVDISKCQKYIDTITAHAWFRRRWGNVSIRVVPGHGARGGGGVIRLGHWARSEAVMIHELAHNLVPMPKYAAHGPEFAGVMLFLVRQIFGKEEATKLREAYKKYGVRVNRKCVPKPEREVQSMAALKRSESSEKKRPLGAWEVKELTTLLEQAIRSGMFGDSKSRTRQQARAILTKVKGNGSGN